MIFPDHHSEVACEKKEVIEQRSRQCLTETPNLYTYPKVYQQQPTITV